MEKAAFRNCHLDLLCQTAQKGLTEFFGPTGRKIPVGIVQGFRRLKPQLLKQVKLAVEKVFTSEAEKFSGYDVEPCWLF